MGLHRFSLATAGLGFILVIAGGLVTSTDSGLAVPDWPLSYGTLFPPMVGGILYEHSHRMIAAAVGLLTVLLALWIFRREPRRSVRWFGAFAFGLVLLQGTLGGITVLLQLPPQVSIAHAALGQTFFSTLVVLATLLSPEWARRRQDLPVAFAPAAPFHLCLAASAVIYVQLILGAMMRHIGWLPQLVWLHISGAAAALVLAWKAGSAVLRAAGSDPFFTRPARILQWGVPFQLALGTTTLVMGADVSHATAHVATGALLLATSATLAVRVFRFLGKGAGSERCTLLPAYLELTKPRLTALAVVSALIGFVLGGDGPPSAWTLAVVLAGTALVGGGAAALNQVLEREQDAKMSRTKNRPIPSGRIEPERALLFGVALSVGGLFALTFGAQPLAGALAAATLGSYLFLYTPMKTRSALCTLVGAVPGALPPMIGWAAARGSLHLEAWVLFAILYLWQLPHFLAIAWEHREEYAQAGFQMLPVLDPEGSATGRQIALYCLALIPVSLLPSALGSSGSLYFFAALASGLLFLWTGLSVMRVRSDEAAHRLFFASILYLPSILVTMTLDRVIL